MTTRRHEFGGRPRIAVVTHAYPSAAEPHRGLPVYHNIFALASHADVEVFCVNSVYPKARFFQPRSFGYRESTSPSPSTSLPVRFIQYPAFPVLTRPFNGFNCSARLTPALSEMRPDLIYACFTYPDGHAAVLTGKRLGIPVIVEPMGSDLRCVNTFWQRRFVSQTMRDAAFVTPVSEDLRRHAIHFGASPDRVRTIRRGCHTNIFRLADRQTARLELQVREDVDLIVFVGRLVEVKGLRELFLALPPLMAARPKLELACIGGGPLEGELRVRAADASIANRVRFLGALEPQAIARWLACANLMCLPSHSEGLPNVIIEALSCGRPVVASNVGGIPEILDASCGILTPPQDPVRLASTILEALSRTWDEKRIAAKFNRSWQDSAKETYDVCLQVLEERGWPARRIISPVARA